MKPLPGDPGLPPGVTDRQIAEEGTHDLERCAGCGALFFAAVLDDNMHCPFCGAVNVLVDDLDETGDD
jgi:hypothetical protein